LEIYISTYYTIKFFANVMVLNAFSVYNSL
jgi:hypothetical protein